MSKIVYYQQCKITKGRTHKTCWLPMSQYVVGKVLKSKEDEDIDEEWTVLEVFEQKLTEEALPNFNKISKSHLRATGDSMPKEK